MFNPFVSMITAAMLLPAQAAESNPEDARLEEFFRAHLEIGFRQRPSSATRLGDHRFDDQLDDVSAAAREKWLAQTKSSLAELPRQVDYQKLSRMGRIEYDILAHSLRRSQWLTENFEPFVTDPRSYGTLISGPVFALLTRSSLPHETNVANAIARIRQVPAVIAAARTSLRNPPRLFVETAIQQLHGDLNFYQTEIFKLAGECSRLAELKEVSTAVVPVLKDYQAFLERDLLPRANGEWRIGPEKFARKFEMETDAGITEAQNYADALAEFDRVRGEMYIIARQAWGGYFPGVVLPPDDPAGRHLTIDRVLQRIGKDHGEPANLVADARATVADIKRFIQQADILNLPDPDRCEIIEMPEFQRGESIAYMASPPPLDPTATGHYAISPPPASWDADRIDSFLEEYNRHMLRILTIHEAYPGHYVQMEYANRNPSLIRKVLGSGVYIEGWAVYTEQMMLDQGFGGGDLALRLSQLKFYLRAVTNKLLDHRMHCEDMTDDQALDLLMNQAFQSEGEARLKVIRSKQSAVQLSTYFTGRMAHYQLRQQIQRELGGNFNLGRYHEAVIGDGPVPMKYLRALVRARLGLPDDG